MHEVFLVVLFIMNAHVCLWGWFYKEKREREREKMEKLT